MCWCVFVHILKGSRGYPSNPPPLPNFSPRQHWGTLPSLLFQEIFKKRVTEKFLVPRYVLQSTVLFLLLLALQKKMEKRYFSLKIESRNTCNFLVLLCFWMMKWLRVCIKMHLTLLTEQKASKLLACKKEKESLKMKESYILPHS